MAFSRHERYNTENFPHLVVRDGYWDIYANEKGECASIPSESGEQAGCRASHFGDLTYTQQVLHRQIAEQAAARQAEAEGALEYAMALATEVPA